MIADPPHRENRADGSTGAAGPRPILQIELLGGFRLAVGEGSLAGTGWRNRKAAQLVKLLALAPDHALHREELCDALWPDLVPDAAGNNLRQALHVARRALRSVPIDPSALLQVHGERVCLYPAERLRVDVEAFEGAARTARRTNDPADYWAAIDRYTGPLLPGDLYEDWVAARRESLAAAYLALLDDVAQLHEAQGEYSSALAALRRIVEVEPAAEAAHVRLMRLFAQTGRRGLALRQYQQLVHALARELDVAPEPATQELFEAIKRGSLPGDGAAGRTDPRAPMESHPTTNLPHALSSFIGRERDVAEVSGLVTAHRLVTLTGPGGAGKTRLALEVGWKQVDDQRDGVWLVELAALTDPTLLAQTVADTLDIRPEGDHAPLAALVTRLRTRALLLILDNCEHLVAACAHLAGTLLDACPGIHILATSREALRVPGERPWLVPPLPRPEVGAGLAKLAADDSVRLFLDRVRWHHPDLTLTSDNATAIATICRRLEGLPLALELAAARAAVLTLPQLAARLDDALGVLAGGSRRAPTRQQTLRATLDWSHALLDPAEQALFPRLAVFRRGWTLPAAEAICAGSDVAPEAVLGLLGQLIDKSLVQADLTEDEARYSLLEPVRQYAAELLEASGEGDRVRARHTAHFLRSVEAIEGELSGPQQGIWFSRLEREHDNLRAVLARALERGDGEAVLRLGGVLWRFWGIRWHSAEGIGWLDAGLRLTPATPSRERARAALGAGELARRILDFDRAVDWLEEALATYRELGDKAGIAWSLAYLDVALGMAGELARAHACTEESLALFRELGDKLGMARSLNALAEDTRLQGDYALAGDYYRESLELDRQIGNQQGVAVRLHNLGYVALHGGDVPQAVRSFRESYLLNRGLGYRTGPLSFLEGAAASASAADRAEQAARLYGAWEAHCAPPGTEFKLHPPDQVEYDRYVARARAAVGDQAFARAHAEGRSWPLERAVAEAQALMSALSGALPSDARGPAGTAVRLTGREREVARLVTRGLTNHQIAVALGVAERTIDTHVGRVLRKLGLSSRHDIAARLGELDSPAVDH